MYVLTNPSNALFSIHILSAFIFCALSTMLIKVSDTHTLAHTHKILCTRTYMHLRRPLCPTHDAHTSVRHTHTHTHIIMHSYICAPPQAFVPYPVSVCVCVCASRGLCAQSTMLIRVSDNYMHSHICAPLQAFVPYPRCSYKCHTHTQTHTQPHPYNYMHSCICAPLQAFVPYPVSVCVCACVCVCASRGLCALSSVLIEVSDTS